MDTQKMILKRFGREDLIPPTHADEHYFAPELEPAPMAEEAPAPQRVVRRPPPVAPMDFLPRDSSSVLLPLVAKLSLFVLGFSLSFVVAKYFNLKAILLWIKDKIKGLFV